MDGKIKSAEKRPASPEELRRQKQEILDGMLAEFAQLRTTWNGDNGYDGWFKHPINNAHLNSVAAYYDYVPAFEQLLAANGGNMARFYDAAEQLSKKPKADRHEQLRALAKTWLAPVRAQADGQSFARAGELPADRRE
jgi:predicted aminopeptidase